MTFQRLPSRGLVKVPVAPQIAHMVSQIEPRKQSRAPHFSEVEGMGMEPPFAAHSSPYPPSRWLAGCLTVASLTQLSPARLPSSYPPALLLVPCAVHPAWARPIGLNSVEVVLSGRLRWHCSAQRQRPRRFSRPARRVPPVPLFPPVHNLGLKRITELVRAPG